VIPAREIVARAQAAGDAGYPLATEEERDAAEVAHRLGCVRLDTTQDNGRAAWRAYLAPGGELLLEEPAGAPHETERPDAHDPIARVRAWVAAHAAPRPAVTEEELRYALHLAATVDARDGVAVEVMPAALRALADTGLVERFRGRAPFGHIIKPRVRPTDAGRAYLAHLRDTATPPERVTDVALRRMLRDASRSDGAPTGTPLRFSAALTLTAAGLAEPLRRPYVADVFDLYATEAGRAALARPPWTCAVPDEEVWTVLAKLDAPAEAWPMTPRERVALDALCTAALAQQVPGETGEARYQRTAYGDEELRDETARRASQRAPAPRPDGIVVALLRSLAQFEPGAYAILSAGERCALPVLTAAGHAEEDNWRGLTRARITDAGRARLATLDAGAFVAASIRAANAETTARRDAFLRECIEAEEVSTDVLLTAVRRFAARACPPGFSDVAARGGVSLADESDGTVSAAACVILDESGTRLAAGVCHGPSDREALRDLARHLYDTTPAAPEGSAAQ